MEHLHNYDDHYYLLEGSLYPEHGAAAAAGGDLYEEALSLDDSENRWGNLNQGGHVNPDSNLGLEGDQRFQEPMELNSQEPVLPQPIVPMPHPRRQQTRFCFVQWQVQEMEGIFQETQYPDEFKRGAFQKHKCS